MNYLEVIDAAVAALEDISPDDPDSAHGMADDILLSMVPLEVKQAYRDLQGRCSWWACA